jgi:hypothetical protein
MTEPGADNALTHSIVNYLLAGYQGQFAAYNILKSLNYSGFSENLIPHCQKVLEHVHDWESQLYQGAALFSSSWQRAETFEANRALSFLDDLERELKEFSNLTATKLSELISGQKQNDSIKVTKAAVFLIAAFGRLAYSRNNYLKGLLDFGKNLKKQEMVELYSEPYAKSDEDVQLTHLFLDSLNKSSGSPEPEFLEGLFMATRPLPYVFRTHIHDIRQLLGRFKGGFSYEQAGFEDNQAYEWSINGLDPVTAGYWDSYEISPETAGSWIRVGISDPQIAWEWESYNFLPENALKWIEAGCPVVIAEKWERAGYSPQKAVDLIQKGITSPEMLETDRSSED